MECREVHSLIPHYIKENMSKKKMVEFIQHVKTCPSCYHELETYFMIHKAIKVLDEDCHASYDLQKILVNDLQKKEAQILHDKNIKICMFFNLIIFIVLFVGVGLYLLLPVEEDLVMQFIEFLKSILGT